MFDYSFDSSISTTKATAGVYLEVDIEGQEVFKGWFRNQIEAIKEAERLLTEEQQKRVNHV